MFLNESKLLEGKTDLSLETPMAEQKRVRPTKESLSKWLASSENLSALDFLKMKDQELIQKVPTLKRFDHT